MESLWTLSKYFVYQFESSVLGMPMRQNHLKRKMMILKQKLIKRKRMVGKVLPCMITRQELTKN